jgi:hypothetical protein
MTHISIEGRPDVVSINDGGPTAFYRLYLDGTVANGPTPLPARSPSEHGEREEASVRRLKQ